MNTPKARSADARIPYVSSTVEWDMCRPSSPPASSMSHLAPSQAQSFDIDASRIDDDHGSDSSITSTLEFRQKPFESFQKNVASLCQDLWPPQRFSAMNRILRRLSKTKVGAKVCRSRLGHTLLPDPNPFKITRLAGGSYNRITGVSVSGLAKGRFRTAPKLDLILRVPRYDFSVPRQEIAMLNYIRHLSQVPVPEVLGYDLSTNNHLDAQYVFYERVPGKDLTFHMDEMSHDQLCSLAVQVGQILRNMQSIQAPEPGIIDSCVVNGNNLDFCIQPIMLYRRIGFDTSIEDEAEAPEVFVPSLDQARIRHPSRWLRTYVQRRRKSEVERSGEESWDVYVWDVLLKIEDRLAEEGLFDNTGCTVNHGDFQPRNIMAETRADGSLSVTSILDWDLAVLAPQYLCCTPPWWLWSMWDAGHSADHDFDESDETYARVTPSDPKSAEIKRLFDEAVGPIFQYYAYSEKYRLARQIFSLARDGIWSDQSIDEFLRIEREWSDTLSERQSSDTSS